MYRSAEAIASVTDLAFISPMAALIDVSRGLSTVQPSAITWPGGVTASRS